MKMQQQVGDTDSLASTQSLKPRSVPISELNKKKRRPGRPVFRESCDTCASSKVKCDKSRPICGRCVSLGSICIYGLSRRRGRPYNTKNNRDCAEQSSTKSSKMTARNHQTTVAHRDSPTPNYVKPEDLMVERPPSFDIDDKQSFDSPENLTSDTSSPFSKSAPPSSDVFDGEIYAFDNMIFHDALRSEDDAWELVSPLQKLRDPPGFVSQHTAMTAATASKTTAAATMMTKDIFQTRGFTMSEHESSCTCNTLADSIQSSLHHQIEVSRGNTSAEPALGQILNMNKIAMQTIDQLLPCLCTDLPHMAMQYASIITGVILLYQIAGNIILLAISRGQSEGRRDTVSREMGSHHVNDGRSRKPPALSTIKVGNYTLGHDDQVMLLLHLLKSELRKAGLVIERFADRTKEKDLEMAKTSDLHGMLGIWVQNELTRTIQSIEREELNMM